MAEIWDEFTEPWTNSSKFQTRTMLRNRLRTRQNLLLARLAMLFYRVGFPRRLMTGFVVLFPVAVTFINTWWFIEFVDGFFTTVYEKPWCGHIWTWVFITSLLFTFFVGIFASSWLGSTVFWLGEQFIR